jgi:hypothetical protein
MEQIYTSKVDAWLVAILLATVVLIVSSLFFFPQTRSATVLLVRLPVLAIGIGLPAWVLLSTKYTLNDATLLVKSGPFSWQVPVAEITSVTPTHNPLSSPALSLDRLRIEYGSQAIMISPRLKEEFMQDLDARRVKLKS